MRFIVLLTFIGYLFIPKSGICDYSVLNRYKLLEDRYKTEGMLRPFGHDFIFDLGASGSQKILDIVDEAKTFNEKEGANAEKYTNAVNFVKKYLDTEYFIKANINVGVPLFSFWMFGIKLVPDLRVDINIGSNVAINTDNVRLTPESITRYIGEGSDTLKTAVSNYFNSYQEGEDLINNTVCADAGIPLGAPCDSLKGKAYFPGNIALPSVGAYIRTDGKAGFLLNFFRRKFFGHIFVYGRYQYDFMVRKSVEAIAWNGKIWDKGTDPPQETSGNMDFKLGHQFKYISIFGMVEELKLVSVKDNKKKAGELNYKNNPLYRLHLDGKFGFKVLELTPFVGIHKRKGYNESDGLYYGGDLGFYLWQDRFGIVFRGMLDKEHVTLASRIKLWLMLLEYSIRIPIVNKVDTIKTSTLHSLDFRLFF